MKNKNWTIFLTASILLFTTLACNTTILQTDPTVSAAPTLDQTPPTVISPTQPQGNNSIPLTEADVPRVTAEEAKAALDSGEAVIVDVRGVEAYAEAHVAGALSIPLTDIEFNPSGVALDKNQWIITYCT